MSKKESFEFWKKVYDECTECGAVIGHFHAEYKKDGTKIRYPCKKCGGKMGPPSEKNLEYWYKTK